MTAFTIALLLVFTAELGDKSQLLAIAFAIRYPLRVVLAGLALAAVLMHGIAAVVGDFAGGALPFDWIGGLSGLLFIGFGVWMWLQDTEPDEPPAEVSWGPFVSVVAGFLLSEFGDKTMLMTFTVAGQQRQWLAVWAGASLGMFVADALAVGLAHHAGRRLPRRLLKTVSAVLFLLSGMVLLSAAWSALSR